MEKRRLGRTGHYSTVAVFGGAAFSRVSQEQADIAMQKVIEHGVNHIDVAPTYGDAELRLGPWMETHRRNFFLGCKTRERGGEESWAELHRTLERLRVDSVDLYQLHGVGDLEDLDKAFAKGGAIETLIRARDEGITRFLGITGHGHDAPATHLEALRRFDFDTVLLPLNFVLWARDDYRRNFVALLDVAAKKDVGVIVIKSIAQRQWGERERHYSTWYEPFSEPGLISRCVRFVLSQGITSLASVGDVRLLPLVLEAAEAFEPMSREEQESLLATAGEYSTIFPMPVPARPPEPRKV